LLTARSILITAIAIAILALVGSLISFLQPPDQGGLGMDTYGTRAQGYRAAFETLQELNFDVSRALNPPNDTVDQTTTLVLWAPQNDLVQIEPIYLQRLRQWIRNGGRLIVAPQAKRDSEDRLRTATQFEFVKQTTVFKEIGLPEIETTVRDLSQVSGSSGNSDSAHASLTNAPAAQDRDSDSFKGELDRYLFPTLFPTQTMKVQTDGKLVDICSAVSTLELPTRVQVLDFDLSKPDGRIVIPLGPQASIEQQDSNARQRAEADQNSKKWPERWPNQPPNAQPQKLAVLAAQFKLGAGDVIVVSDPAIFDNRLVSLADNAVLAVDLMGHPRQPIVWDEFYHGLTVRGNPLFLLTRSYYGLVAGMIVALTACWVWRKSVFLGPPLADSEVMRRTLAEYVEAMASFFKRGSESLSFMLEELRRGVLWSLRRKFGSPKEYEIAEDVAAAVACRDPEKARKLLNAVAQADLLLSSSSRAKQRDILEAAKDILDCL
jgi:hypothetical protein